MKTAKTDMALLGDIFRYISPSALPLSFVYGGKKYSGMPETASVVRRRPDSLITEYTVTARVAPELTVRAEYLEYRDFPVTEFVAYFTNESDSDSAVLSEVMAVDGVLPAVKPVLEWSNGDDRHDTGYELTLTPLDVPFSLNPSTGCSCCGAFPYMRLLREGGGVNIAIGWTGAWKADFEPVEGGVRFKTGQMTFASYLKPGETVRTPRVNFMAYAGDEDRGCNLWRRWYMAHILPRENGAPLGPMLCLHNMCIGGTPEFTGITTENQVKAIDAYAARGLTPDIWWIDAGWYPCGSELAEDGVWRGGNWTVTGTWTADERRMPGGLGEIGDKCHEHGARLLVWFEPERVRRGTELDLEHPEWLLYPGGNREAKEDRLLNLGDPEALEFILDRVDGLIKKYHIDIYRQDFNFDPPDRWASGDGEGRQGITENLHIQGYMRYFDELALRNPGLWIDSCASGGRRNDLETMRRAVPLHYTDVKYGVHPVKQKQYRLMHEWIPYFRSHTLAYDNDEGAYDPVKNRKPDLFTYIHSTAPSITSTVLYDDSDELIKLALDMEPIWRRAARIMLAGDYYPLTPCRKNPADLYADQFWDENQNEGFVRIVANPQFNGSATITPHTTPNTTYQALNPLTGEHRTFTHSDLSSGLTLTPRKRTAELWFYRKEDGGTGDTRLS